MRKTILVVGAGGQIGTELVPHLQSVYGDDHVIAAELRPEVCRALSERSRTECLNALDREAYATIMNKYRPDWVFNLVAVLSATGEKNPQTAWHINMGALFNTLELAREFGCGVFTPSSIGAFGKDTPPNGTPQDTVMRPNTIYGVCKVSGELLSDYYHSRFGVDTRSVRFPGIISHGTLPGGGTTDYAVEIFYAAVRGESFICPLPHNAYMDMMYMPDALEACSRLIEADPNRLLHRNSFNITAMSFCPRELYEVIRRRIPAFRMEYRIDPVKEAIANSWPNYMDDSCARTEWGWSPRWDIDSMADDMLKNLRKKLLE
ncbi:MAG: NAD-dependent epimerase/dehydratase family protein [Bacteroidales bacterium]|jgi:nucleoside-diphosphate-sugar epimerase|nr:NAD-dependent epimerase/dehydratase family protein [Bacteroidales bacterium]MDD2823682.1 NAD-dependent epimerase/dehydratase family protein [Bacteroidales bacterium]MDD3099977.1 NAD-dependent epimerase/dehydratase family protein [Bacteroidales bacterium]MDD3638743.1 NAD-dependent epimerase/dehydratase family protein [Bacteroidales bacterium]MDD3943478.1 NAD-dependent epimerase/dehydratase family protein [Bacteroidales bacterium]